MCQEDKVYVNAKSTSRADDAVGVPNFNHTRPQSPDKETEEEKKWFVAIVNNRSEKKTASSIRRMGYESFVPIQNEKHTWGNGTVRRIDRILVPAMVFIHCTEPERKKVVNYPFVKRFMVDHTRKKNDGRHPVAVIPDHQMQTFRQVLEKAHEPVTIEPMPLNVGDKVKVMNGHLEGIEGKVLQLSNGSTFLIIEIELLGCAKLKIDGKQLMPL